MKTKRLMSIVLALTMLCTMFGNLTALADDINADTTYTISNNSTEDDYAIVTIDKTEAKKDDEVTVKVKLNEDCECSYIEWHERDGSNSGKIVDYTTDEAGARVYTFKMPAGNIYVFAYTYALDFTLEMFAESGTGGSLEGVKYKLEFENSELNKSDYDNLTIYNRNDEDENYSELEDQAVLHFGNIENEKVTITITDVPKGYENPGSVTLPFVKNKTDYKTDSIFFSSYFFDARGIVYVHLLEKEKTTFNLTVKGVDSSDNGEITSGSYNITYYDIDSEKDKTEEYQNFGEAKSITTYEDSYIEISNVTSGAYSSPAETIKFKADEIARAQGDNYKVTRDDDGNYTLTVTLTKTMLPPTAGGDDIVSGGDDDTDETTSPFTVKAVVNGDTEDVDTAKEGTQVNAKDTVKVDVVVSGGAFTNADWEMVYDPTLFEYKSTTTNVDTTKGTVTTDDTKTAVLSGSLIANAGLSTGDEFADSTAIVTYEFTAKAQNADKIGTFKIESAHANNYVIAGTQDNKVANTENAMVEIVLVDDTEDNDDENGTVTVPAGTFTAAEKTYNAQKQTGNAFELDEDFANAKVTYFANEDGSAVEDTADLATKSFKTTLPSWKDVGTYTYYAEIYGDGLKTTYVSTTLTIKKATLIPSAMFTVDPSTGTNDVEFVPTLEGALDGTHNGTVTVTYTDKDGAQSVELQASAFVYDGETTSVYNGTIKTTAPTSGEFTVTLSYASGDADNYTGSENTAKVNVDKITANKVTVDALEETITSVFGYDSTPHKVTVDTAAVTTVTNGDWEHTISNTEASVTNVGDDKMVKVTFTDKNGVYNDVIVYVILKVTPANVKITVNNDSKVMNDVDPELTGTIQVVDEDGNAVDGMDANKLYGEDDLEVSYEREAGEAVGTYNITASYAPNDNYTVEVVDGTFTITAPSTDDTDPENPAKVKIEVVDHSYEADGTPDYTAGKRLILVYTDLDKLFYGYSITQSADDAEAMFDVTAAGYKYTKYTYAEDGTVTADVDNETSYKHIYGIVVDKLDSEATGAALEALYKANVVFLSSDLSDAPVNIVYDGDINLSNEIDVNDYSMTNGIYNNQYARATYIKNILKADINGDKKVDTTDVANVKGIYEAKN